MFVRQINNLTLDVPKTYLATAISSGTAVLPVKSWAGFSSSWAVQLGETAENQAEVLLLGTAALSGTLGTATANCLYDHPADTPVYAIKYDKVVFERSTAGTAGTASPIAGGTLAIQVNQPKTLYDDTTGSSSYAYKTYWQNSVTGGTSLESGWIIPAGGTPSLFSLGKLRQRAKNKLVNASYIPDDQDWTDWINEWGEVMNNTAIDVDEGYSMGTFTLSFAANQELGTITQADFKQLRRVWFQDASGAYQATKMESNTFSPNKTFSVSYPYFYFEGDNVIGRKPGTEQACGVGSMLIEYYRLFTPMVNDNDSLPVNMQGYSKTFVDYADAQALARDQKTQESQAKLAEAMNGLAMFKKEITPRSKTGPTYEDIVEDTAADQELWI